MKQEGVNFICLGESFPRIFIDFLWEISILRKLGLLVKLSEGMKALI
jgi:hypothetical protein